MTKHSCELNVNKKTVKKRFKKNNNESQIKFLRELNVYLLAKQKGLKFIPNLIRYDIVKKELVTENVGKSLGLIPEEDWQDREKHLPGISKIYKKLEKYGLYHNDLRYKNIIWNKCNNKYYLIDFESTSQVNEESDGDYIQRNIQNKILKKKKKKTKKKR